jgi:hypothetical protein
LQQRLHVPQVLVITVASQISNLDTPPPTMTISGELYLIGPAIFIAVGVLLARKLRASSAEIRKLRRAARSQAALSLSIEQRTTFPVQ